MKQHEEVEAPGTDVVGAIHYCIYLVYFACELRPSGSPQSFVYIFMCDIYKGKRGGGGGGCRGSLYQLSVTTTDLLSVRGFTALSAVHKELLCHIRYPHGEMDYPLSILNIHIRCPHGFFISICHLVSCQKLSYCCNCSLSLHTYMTPRGTKMYVGRRTNQIIGAPSIFVHPICENLIILIIWT